MPKQSITDPAPGAPGTTRAADHAVPRPRAGAPGSSHPASRPTALGRRGPRAAAWLLGALALGALLVRASFTVGMDSDAANKALQGWDLLHGHLLLHGWITGDATFYALESPICALVEAFTGLSPLVMHVEPALVFLLVLGLVLLLGRGAAVGWAAVLRALAAAAVMLVSLGSPYGISLLIEQPDHLGTAAFLLAAFVLADRAETLRPWVSPCGVLLVCTAGILSDDTVTYVAVPALVAVCGLRVLSKRRPTGGDAAVLLAALAAIPLEHYVRVLMRRFGGYWMTRPATKIAPSQTWPGHLHRTLRAVAALYGVSTSGSAWPVLAPVAVLGGCALLAAAAGFARVLWLWRETTRGEQLCVVAIVLNLAVYTLSTAHTPIPAHEVAAVLPLGAVLAARGISPAWAWWRRPARRACLLLALAAVAPMAVSALRPPQPPIPTAPAPALASWLDGHGLRYGIAGYWDAATLTVDSGGAVRVRAIVRSHHGIAMYAWETRQDWYDPRRHDATFAVAYDGAPAATGLLDSDILGSADFEAFLGKPAEVYRIDGRTVLVYPGNLLDHVTAWLPPRAKRE
jgi:hypothetical protein